MQLFYSLEESLIATFQLYKERSFMRKVSFLFGFYKRGNFVLRLVSAVGKVDHVFSKDINTSLLNTPVF